MNNPVDEQIWSLVKNSIFWSQVEGPVYRQVRRQIGRQVWRVVMSRVGNQIWTQIDEQSK